MTNQDAVFLVYCMVGYIMLLCRSIFNIRMEAIVIYEYSLSQKNDNDNSKQVRNSVH